MRVLVNLEDREVVVQFSRLEEQRFTNGELKLKNIGIIYEYDDMVEYCCRYMFTLKKLGEYYTVVVEREGADGNWYKYFTLKFRNLTDLQVVVSLIERKCTVRKITKKEREILNQHVLQCRNDIMCSAAMDFNLYDVIKRAWIIGKKFRLF